jgi:hypothetical protein
MLLYPEPGLRPSGNRLGQISHTFAHDNAGVFVACIVALLNVCFGAWTSRMLPSDR